MPLINVVLDTNSLLRCLSRKSAYSAVIQKLYEGKYQLNVTTDILFEYEEKITHIFSKDTAELTIGALILLPNVKKIDVHFHLNLIKGDADDNKFVDCAFAGNANFIVTDDRHFNELKTVGFPQLKAITLNEFKEYLLAGN
jgi:uncharacterized protein